MLAVHGVVRGFRFSWPTPAPQGLQLREGRRLAAFGTLQEIRQGPPRSPPPSLEVWQGAPPTFNRSWQDFPTDKLCEAGWTDVPGVLAFLALRPSRSWPSSCEPNTSMVNGPGKTYEVALEKLDLVSTRSRSSSVSARRPFRTPEGGAEETRGVQEHSIDHILATGIETSHEQNSCRTTWVYFARSTRSHHSRTRTIARQPAPALASAELQS